MELWHAKPIKHQTTRVIAVFPQQRPRIEGHAFHYPKNKTTSLTLS